MNERDLLDMQPDQVLRILKSQVDAAVSMGTFGTLVYQKPTCRDGHCGRLLNFEVGDFRITARFTEPHD
jgi:hypothetical protein